MGAYFGCIIGAFVICLCIDSAANRIVAAILERK